MVSVLGLLSVGGGSGGGCLEAMTIPLHICMFGSLCIYLKESFAIDMCLYIYINASISPCEKCILRTPGPVHTECNMYTYIYMNEPVSIFVWIYTFTPLSRNACLEPLGPVLVHI